ncbi:ADP-ribosylation factor-like protein 16 [Eurytemora carolleeae]|uniref:ADP-ribosylation factor-like protein 16 n=1 Tax=Eurytemora carolleeae TaxID=1294199 RepID=UPI000C78DBDE|nr:ADP-ribosylation factor-like protein 16 [Eurytemora carolleeae]|eukprot:XP_023329318.1 ADP-ribosylation factor-like protein 16 [Eurytemora affinis]
MILCVGTTGSGKTLLLRALAENANPGSVNKHTTAVSTTGANITNITRINPKKPELADSVRVREIGGTMSPLWGNFVEAGRTQVIYVVDVSAPEKIGPATIDLIELLNQPALQGAPFLIVFSKTDIKSSRTLNELKQLMRLDEIKEHSTQELHSLDFNTEETSKIEPILNWCLKFKNINYEMMNGTTY